MALSTQSAVSDGTLTNLNVSIGYIKQADISVFFNGVPAGVGTWAWVGDTAVINFTPAVANGVTVLLKRTTQINQVINRFAAGAAFTNQSVDTDFLQSLYLAQEFTEGGSVTDAFEDFDFHGFKAINLGDATAPGDAVPLRQFVDGANLKLDLANGADPLKASALVAHTAAGAGAVATTVQQVLRETNVGLRRMNAALIADIQAGSATISAVAGLVAADAIGPVTLVAGTYLISANMTFTKRVTFLAGAKLSIATGVVVTFNKQVQAHGDEQIFYGLGTVAGLKKCKVGWFCGDNTDIVTDSRTLIQKAYDACATSADMRWVHGNLFTTGATPIAVTKGQRTRGYGKLASKLLYTTATCNGIHFSGAPGGGLSGMTVGANDFNILPTAGEALKVTASYTTLSDFIVSGGFSGLTAGTGSGNGTAFDFEINDCMEVGFFGTNFNDFFISDFLMVAILDRFTLSGVTGTFVATDVLTGGTSGATAASVEVLSGTLLRAHATSKNFTPGETITGSVSGATATLVSQVVGFRLGGIRLQDKAEAFIASDGDIIGGQFSMTTAASVYASGVRPAYNKLSNVYFDSADNGCLWDNSIEFDFVSCWLSNRPNNGGELGTVENFRFTGGGAINSAKVGLIIGANAKGVRLSAGFAAAGNSTEAANAYDGIVVAAGATDFHFDIRAGGTLGFGTQRYGVFINGGASDRYTIRGDVTGNGTGGISDGGTGLDKVIDVQGYRTKNKGAAAVAVGQTVVQINHGLPITPLAQDFIITAASLPSASGINTWNIVAITATTFQIQVNTAVVTQAMQFGWAVRTAGA